MNLFEENMLPRDIVPVDAGAERCERGHSYGPAVRSYYLLHYVVSGRGKFSRAGEVSPVKQGQIFVIRPEEETLYEADSRDPWEYLWIAFESRLLLPDLLAEDVLTAPECGHIFASAARYKPNSYSADLFLCGKIFELLSIIVENRRILEPGVNAYIQKAKAFVARHYSEQIGVQDIAGHLSLDRSYFSSMFKKNTGIPPQQYLVRFRLEKAAELMVGNGLAPQAAAVSVGYTDLCNFSKMFKRKFGLSPRNYAKHYSGSAGEPPGVPPGVPPVPIASRRIK